MTRLGLERYLPWGCAIRQHTLRGTEGKEGVLTDLAQHLEALEVKSRRIQQACAVADELLMNALFNAPVDGQGNRLFAHLPRSKAVEIPPPHEIRCQFGSDGEFLWLSVLDTFGSLSGTVLLRHLSTERPARTLALLSTGPGAGLGLAMVRESVSDFIVNLAPGRATEMVGSVDIRSAAGKRRATARRFNLFEVRDGFESGSRAYQGRDPG